MELPLQGWLVFLELALVVALARWHVNASATIMINQNAPQDEHIQLSMNTNDLWHE